jgi:hydrogenase maturation protease
MKNIIIIGIGNPFRGDDKAGWAVVDLLETFLSNKIPLLKSPGDVEGLLEEFTENDKVILIDACRTNEPIGSWKKIDGLHHHLPRDAAKSSTHSISLGQAIDLARAMQKLPKELIIFAIPGEEYSITSKITPAVQKAIEEVAQEILKDKDVLICMSKA